MEYKYTLVSGEQPGKIATRKGFHTRSEAADAWVKAQEAEPEKTHKVVDLTVSDVMELVEVYSASRLAYENSYDWDSYTTRDRDKLRTEMETDREDLRATIEGLLS